MSEPDTLDNIRGRISVNMSNIVGNRYPSKFRSRKAKNKSVLKRDNGIQAARFTFSSACTEINWKALSQHADKIQDEEVHDHIWKDSEQNNRCIRVFPSRNSLESLFDIPNLLTRSNIGWESQESGDFRYGLLGSVSIGSDSLANNEESQEWVLFVNVHGMDMLRAAPRYRGKLIMKPFLSCM